MAKESNPRKNKRLVIDERKGIAECLGKRIGHSTPHTVVFEVNRWILEHAYQARHLPGQFPV